MFLKAWRVRAQGGRPERRPRGKVWAVARPLVGVVLALCWLPLNPEAAQAHTELEGSAPAASAVLDTAPRVLRLRFTDDIDAQFARMSLRLAGGDATRLAPTVRGNVVTVRVPGVSTTKTEAEQVQWNVAFRVVSADGHPVAGVVAFRAPAPLPPVGGQPGTLAEGREKPRPASGGGGQDEPSGATSEGALVGVVAGVVVLGLSSLVAVGVLMTRRRRARPT